MVEKRAVPLALVGLTLLLFAPFWLLGRVFVPGDFTNFVYPWRAVNPPVVHNLDLFDTAVFFYPQDVFLNESLKSGDLPLWNPRIFCGHPIVASGQSALLYPPRLLAHWALTPAVAKTLLLMLHTAGMGLAMYGWLRSRGLSCQGAGVGGLCWMLNAFTSSWMELDLIAYMGAYLPLMLWAIDRRHWPALAVLGALTLHAGHLQMAFYVGLVVIFYAILVIVSQKAWRLIPAFLASGVAVLMMAAPTVLPFLELLKQSQRATFSFEALQRFSTSLGGMLLSLLNPDFLGNPSRGFAFNRAPSNFPFYEYAAYIGLIPLAFAVLAVVRAGDTVWKAREIRIWGGLAVTSLLLATATPMYHLALLLVPVLSRALPGRFVLMFVFAGCVLAAHGFEVWRADIGARRGVARALLPISVLTALAQTGFALWLNGGARAWIDSHRDGRVVKVPAYDAGPAYLDAVTEGLRHNYLWNPQLAMTVLAGLLIVYLVPRPRPHLLIGFVALDLFLFAQHFNTTVSPGELLPTTPSIRFLQQQPGLFRVEKESAAFYNLLYPYGLNLVTGYESLFPKRYSETMRKAQPEGDITMRSVAFTQFESPILSAMNLAFLLQAPLDLKAPRGWPKVFEQDARVFSNPRVLPRTFVRGNIKPFRTFEQALAYLGSPEFDPAVEAVTEQLLPGPVSPVANSAVTEVRLYEPDRVAIDADLPGPGVLVLADTFYPGWICRDRNGQNLPIFPVNGTSRGVYLTQGRHQLLFEFRPPQFTLGLRLCALGLIGSLLAAVFRERRRDKVGVRPRDALLGSG